MRAGRHRCLGGHPRSAGHWGLSRGDRHWSLRGNRCSRLRRHLGGAGPRSLSRDRHQGRGCSRHSGLRDTRRRGGGLDRDWSSRLRCESVTSGARNIGGDSCGGFIMTAGSMGNRNSD